jgi:3-hydroxyisobutyrate dehydrogenase-like beta-hydroxyacid dehydrogenase
MFMDEDVKEVIKIGIIGEGGLARLFITQLLKTNILLSLLQSRTNECFEGKHIRYHDSLSSLTRDCSVIITILSDGPELESILFDNDGVAN